MSYRDPLEAARARITALEELLESQRFGLGAEHRVGAEGLREVRGQLAEERAEHQAELMAERERLDGLRREMGELEASLVHERSQRRAEVSLLRSKLEEAERAMQQNAALFEAEQTVRRAEAEAEAARLRQALVVRDTVVRELREEVRVHLDCSQKEVRAYYEARARVVGTEIAEQGTLARKLDELTEGADRALGQLPPADPRDREALLEREVARRKVAVARAERVRVKERLMRLEAELKRITAAEATLAGHREA